MLHHKEVNWEKRFDYALNYLVKRDMELTEHLWQHLTTKDKPKYDIDYNKKVIVIGNEANGVEQKIQDIADIKVKIPMLGKTESLNASVAAGIVMYEVVKQRG